MSERRGPEGPDQQPTPDRAGTPVRDGCLVGCSIQALLVPLFIGLGWIVAVPALLLAVPLFTIDLARKRAGFPGSDRKNLLLRDAGIGAVLLLLALFLAGGPVVIEYSGFDESPIEVEAGTFLTLEAMGDWSDEPFRHSQVGPYWVRIQASGNPVAGVEQLRLESESGLTVAAADSTMYFNEYGIVVLDQRDLAEETHRVTGSLIRPDSTSFEFQVTVPWQRSRRWSLLIWERLMSV